MFMAHIRTIKIPKMLERNGKTNKKGKKNQEKCLSESTSKEVLVKTRIFSS